MKCYMRCLIKSMKINKINFNLVINTKKQKVQRIKAILFLFISKHLKSNLLNHLPTFLLQQSKNIIKSSVNFL